MTFANIPDELKALNQWLCWRYVEVDGDKPTKVPYNPRTGFPASVTNQQDWSPFLYALEAAQSGKYDGIGFVFTDKDPYTGIDLDTPMDEDGNSLLTPDDLARQQLIFQKMDSYSERSPSGKGLHIITKASVPHGRKRSTIEVYSSGRYFTMTGDVFHNAPIADRQELVSILWTEMGVSAQPNYYEGDATEHHADQEVYDMAARARNGDLFLRLWEGDTSGYFSASEADFALIDIIAYYTKNKQQIKRMFMASTLGKRDKYSQASEHRLNRLTGYMINKSFDRMLPPVDLSGVLDQVNAAMASAARGADLTPPSEPRRAAPADPLPVAAFAGYSTTLWRELPPPGILGMLADFIYAASPRPVYEISLAAAMGLMAGITGRAYNVSGTGLNQYIMLLAVTGTGKEAMSSGINRLMSYVGKELKSALEFIGPAELASGQGLLKHLSERGTPCFVSLVGEIGLRMQQLTHPNASTSDIQLRRVMLDLFNKSGAGNMVHPTVYSDKKNNTDVIHSPSFSLLGDSTPETFYRALDEDSVVQGLLPRFTIIEYEGPRVPLNDNHADMQPPYELVTAIASLAKACHENMANGHVTNIFPNAEASELLSELDRFADAQINKSETDVLRQLWNRFHLKVFKIAGIIAVSVNPYLPTIDRRMVEWASSLVMADTQRMLRKFTTGEIGGNNINAMQLRDLKHVMKWWLTTDYASLPQSYQRWAALHAAKAIPLSVLSNKLRTAAFRNDKRGANAAIDGAVKDAIANGYLQEVPPQQKLKDFGITSQLRVFTPVDAGFFLFD